MWYGDENMVNLENKLTVDDLIVEYMIYKVKNGFEPSFYASEFIDFLHFFECKMEVIDSIYEKDKLFQRFFERKVESDWTFTTNLYTCKKKIVPHMEMKYSVENGDYLIFANYKLGTSDQSMLNTYYMDNGLGMYADFKGQTYKIRSIIGEYLSTHPKRKIDETTEISKTDLLIGKSATTLIIQNIWDSYITKLIEKHRWPIQCTDINKYLLDIDLAEIINVDSIKKPLLDFYDTISKRIAILYSQDKSLQIDTNTNNYLARSNYELIIQGYESIMDIAFGRFKKSLKIDLSNMTSKESHEIDGIYGWDEDPDIKTTTTNFESENIVRLVKSLDKNQHKSNN